MALSRDKGERATGKVGSRLVLSNWSWLLAGGVLLFLGGMLIGNRFAWTSEAASANPDQTEFSQAIQAANNAIDKRDFRAAHDFILAGSLLQPKSGKLFDEVLHFIEKAAASDDDEPRLLAEDLLSRCEGLIAYQPVSAIPDARKRFDDAAQRLAANDAPPPPGVTDPLGPIEALVKFAGNKDLPLEFRTRACDDARNSISDFRFTLAKNPSPDVGQDVSKRLDAFEAEVNRFDQECIALEYRPIGQKAVDWIAATNKLLDEIRGWKDGKRDDAKIEQLNRKIQDGNDLLRELAAYAKLDAGQANGTLQKVESLTEASQRAINWAYNVQILSLVRELESDKKTPSLNKIARLAVVREEELAPEVHRRHNALWDKVYGELQGDDQQVMAIRMRILRTSK